MQLVKNNSDIFREAQMLQDPAAYHEASEWLDTNGLGGWASSSVIGCNTRRYHGLLIAATKPPAQRMALVSRLDEAIVSNDERIELGTNDYDGVIHPRGYQHITSFRKNLVPEWTYEVNGIVLKKTIAMVHGENTTVLIYEVLQAPRPFHLELLPLISARGYHFLQRSYNNIFWDAHFEKGIFKTLPYDRAPNIFIQIPGSTYHHDPKWIKNFNYRVEKDRGLDFVEDLFNHGFFNVQLKQGDRLGVIISTENTIGRNAFELFENEIIRRRLLIKNVKHDIARILTLAADQFIVKRGEDLKTIIAGYHWFTDWGRDAMISLPGLCLSTSRFDDARKILAAFAQSVSMGMLPNRFGDNNEPPEYNNVDGTLWYFVAIYKYLESTNDTDFILSKILPVLKDIIDWHFSGTRYNIHVDEDGLLFAGEKDQQLTWMDARIGDWVVTPRMGKPVEVQALWYNALNIFAELLDLNDQASDAALVRYSAEKAKKSFLEKFWFSNGKYLYDVIDENNNPDPSLRPNQLFAISLPFQLIEGEHAASVLEVVSEKLYTPVGLKSLPSDDPRYVGVYGGDPFKRDSSYHQGTVWSWLLGAYIDAIIKVDTENGKQKATQVLNDFKYHLNEGCIGSVTEIFDAGPPHHPRGCVAQAWGVAEILRVIKEYHLDEIEIEAAADVEPGIEV